MQNSDRLIEKIKDLNIKPKPRWQFTLRTILSWFVFVISVVFGAMAFSVILFAVQQLDFNLITHMSHSRFEFMLGLVPFFWIISLVIFLIISMVGIQKSKKGYKFSVTKLVSISVAFSILLGTLFFIGGGAQWLENAFAVKIGMYESIQTKKMKIWMNPEEGYLAGTITAIEETSSFELTDFSDHKWKIYIDEANIPPIVLIEAGEKVKIVGTLLSNHEFKANELRPWGADGRPGSGRGRRFNKSKRPL